MDRLINFLVIIGFGADAVVEENPAKNGFIERCRSIGSPRVLELGARPIYATRCDSWIPHAREYLGTDIEPGEDVDIIADVHRLTRATGEEQFDIIISLAGFEHFKYPFLAAHEIMKALRIGGLIYIETVQTFPLHYAPSDYFRYSQEGLEALFGTKMGFRVLESGYCYPAKIYSPQLPNCRTGLSFLCVYLIGEKTYKTPDKYVYDFE